MAKRPAFMFYTGDWLKDSDLGGCSPATRGVWVDLLCLMHENGQTGKLEKSVAGLARMCRVTPAEMDLALKELKDSKTGNVTFGPSEVTVVCRRMEREHREREGNRLRKRRQRASNAIPEESRSPSSVSSSISISKEQQTRGQEFDSFWKKYPRRDAKQAAWVKWLKLVDEGTATPEQLETAAENYATTCKSAGTKKQYTLMPSTFLGPQARYLDHLDAQEEDDDGLDKLLGIEE